MVSQNISLADGLVSRYEHFLGLTKKELQLWRGLRSMRQDLGKKKSVDILMKSLNKSRDQAERIYDIMKGTRPQLSSFVDFNDNPGARPFVFPGDRNRHLIWLAQDYQIAQKNMLNWFLCRMNKRSDKMASALKELFVIAAEKYEKDHKVVLRESFEDFDTVVMKHGPQSYAGPKDLFFLIHFNSLFVDIAALQHFKEELTLYIKTLIYKYMNLHIDERRLVNTEYSRAVSLAVDLGLEYNFYESADEFFQVDWGTIWPLKFRGTKFSRMKMPIAYEISYRAARGYPIDFESLIAERRLSELSKMRHISGLLQMTVYKYLDIRPWKASEFIGECCQQLCEYYDLSEYECLKLLSGEQDLYKDSRNNYIKISKDHIEFFVALKELGLKPYVPTRREKRALFGRVEPWVGFFLDAFEDPVAVVYSGYYGSQNKPQQARLMGKIERWSRTKVSFLYIWYNQHVNDIITPATVRRTILSLKDKSKVAARIAEKI